MRSAGLIIQEKTREMATKKCITVIMFWPIEGKNGYLNVGTAKKCFSGVVQTTKSIWLSNFKPLSKVANGFLIVGLNILESVHQLQT